MAKEQRMPLPQKMEAMTESSIKRDVRALITEMVSPRFDKLDVEVKNNTSELSAVNRSLKELTQVVSRLVGKIEPKP